jgi:hypothetical protein
MTLRTAFSFLFTPVESGFHSWCVILGMGLVAVIFAALAVVS